MAESFEMDWVGMDIDVDHLRSGSQELDMASMA